MSNKIYNQEKIYGGNFALNIFDGTKIGSVITYTGDDIPDGFLECDGSDVSRTDYKALFEVIGTKFGEGDGSTTFTLPNIADITDPKMHFLIKWNIDGSMLNYATKEKSGFVRFATDPEAEYSVREDVAINAKQLKLAVAKTDLRNRIYGTDENGRQTLYDKDFLYPIGSYAFGVKPEIGEWEEIIPQGKYQHNIVLRDSSTVFMIFNFTNNDASSYNTLEKISKAIYDLGYKNEATALISSGSRGTEASYMGVFSSNGTSLTTYKVHTQKWEGTTWVTVNDTVRTLIDYNIYKRIA